MSAFLICAMSRMIYLLMQNTSEAFREYVRSGLAQPGYLKSGRLRKRGNEGIKTFSFLFSINIPYSFVDSKSQSPASSSSSSNATCLKEIEKSDADQVLFLCSEQSRAALIVLFATNPTNSSFAHYSNTESRP
ncbi:hypothetical protein Scep_028484 [Stephania cephalantha]|uniref:Uncharacterized protein n=1 Tax=Stephania cephalantha TaxID=152367 RepID=A0AAP0EEL8_9MAGN